MAEVRAVEHQYVEVPCSRSIAGPAFAAGLQEWPFSIGRPSAVFFSKSYMVFDLTLLGASIGPGFAENQPRISESLALAENCVACLYSNAYLNGGGSVISSIVNYLPQASQLEMRTKDPAAWQKSVGPSAFAISGDFSSRSAAVSVMDNPAGVAGGAAVSPFDAPIGLSGLSGKERIYRNAPAAATVEVAISIVSANSVVTGGGGTTFALSDAGASIVINGARFTILSVDVGAQTLIIVNGSSPAVIATRNWYMVGRDSLRSQTAQNRVQVIWRPPLGIFSVDKALGSGDYRLQLSPEANYAAAAVECLQPGVIKAGAGVQAAGNTYTLIINDARLYVATAKVPALDPTMELYLTEYQPQSKPILNDNTTLSFSVPSSTVAIHCFLQAPSAGTSPLFPPTAFRGVRNSDLPLQTLQISFAGVTRPMTRWPVGFQIAATNAAAPVLTAGVNQNRLGQFYWQNLIEQRRENSSGGCESMSDFLARGPYYSFRFDRDMANRATEIQLAIGYSPSVYAGNSDPAQKFDDQSKIFIIAEYSRTVEVSADNGQIVNVRSLNV